MWGKGHEEIPRNLQIKVYGNILESLEVFSKKKFCFKKLGEYVKLIINLLILLYHWIDTVGIRSKLKGRNSSWGI